MSRRRLLLAAALVVLAAGGAARAQSPPPPPGGPTQVSLGFHVIEVRDVDLKSERFFADFYLWIRYPAAADPGRAKQVERIEFMNGRADATEEVERKAIGDATYVCWRVAGTFGFVADLRNYPFDTQRLDLVVEHPALETDDLVYVDDARSYERGGGRPELWGAREGIAIPQFTLRRVERGPVEMHYRTDFGDLTLPEGGARYSRIVLSMWFSRDYMSYFFKIVIPLVVIVAMAYVVFFLPPKEIQTASGLAITALLSCIALNVSVGQNLPEVGYLVVSDKFFIMTYVLLFLTLLQSVVTYVWEEKGLGERALRWDRLCRWVFPVLYTSAFAYLLGGALLTR